MRLNGRIAKLEEIITPPKRETDESQPQTLEEFIFWLFQCSAFHFDHHGRVAKYLFPNRVIEPDELCLFLNEYFATQIYIPLHADVVERVLHLIEQNHLKLDKGLYLVKYTWPAPANPPFDAQACIDCTTLDLALRCYRRQIQNPAWPVAVEQVEQLLLQLNAMPSLNPGYLFQKSNLI